MMKPMSGGGGVDTGLGAAGKAVLPTSIQAELSGSILDWNPSKVAGDANVDVLTCKIHKGDELDVLVIVHNLSGSAISDVGVQLDTPRNLRASFMGEPAPAIHGNRLTLSNIGGHSRAFIVVKLGFVDVAPSMAVRGQVGYKSDKGMSSLSFQTVIDATDLLRPVPLSTDEFGGRWSGMGDGKRVWISPTSVKTPAEYMRRVQSDMCLHPVATIGTECISAGQVMGRADIPVMLHAAIDIAKNGVNITVNSTKGPLTDLVCRCCKERFA